ncbi:MAG: class I SAM-dependent methyltransferase [Patescibacteria group bacterium]|nr:class I SAM-dependent methyltransferase [Patescibacteria group bacterium]
MKKALELGCGDLKEANVLTDYDVLAIDKKINGTPAAHVTALEADYFDVEIKDQYNLVYSNYSLCFNKKEVIQSRLPKILSHLLPSGIFILNDFSNNEKTVLKRTNLDETWFFDLIRSNVGEFEVKREQIFEEEHGHFHQIFQIQAIKR